AHGVAGGLLPAAGVAFLADDRGIDRVDDVLDLLALAAAIEEAEVGLELGIDVPYRLYAGVESDALLGPVEGRLRLLSRSSLRHPASCLSNLLTFQALLEVVQGGEPPRRGRLLARGLDSPGRRRRLHPPDRKSVV